MRRIHPLVAGIGLLLAIAYAFVSTAFAQEADDNEFNLLRNQAVELARTGWYEQALATFDQLQTLNPDAPGILNDRLDVLSLAGRHKEATVLADSDRFSEALTLLEKIRRDYPGYIGVDFDILAVHAWAGQYAEAAEMALSLPLDKASDSVLQAVAMAYRETGKLKQSELLYRDLLARHPHNQAIAEGLALTLVKACNLDQASALIDQYKTTYGSMLAAETALVRAKRDQAAALAKDGKYDEALALLRNARVGRFGHPGIEQDMLAIHSWMGAYTDAAALADRLNLQTAPAYVQSAAAKAYRELGDFDKAETLYRDLLAREPSNAEYAAGLAMTAIGKNNVEEAELLLERYARRDPAAMEQVENALVAARNKQPNESVREQPLPPARTELSNREPADTLANAETVPQPPSWKTRGWRRLGEGTTWEDFGISHTAASPGAQQGEDSHNLYELRMDVTWSRVTSGINPVLGSGDDPVIETRLYSKTFARNWRVFGGFATAGGDYDEGHARQNIYLGGIEYSLSCITAQLEARADHVNDTKFGLQLSGEITPDERWRIPFNFELCSRDTPLRARRSDITAKAAGTGLSYAWSENGSFNSRVSLLDFSDDNQRFSIAADVTERLFTWADHYIDGSINGYTSWNSKDAHRPYFNPKHDFELGGALAYGNRLWVSDDRAFSHALTVAAGNYHQRYYGSGIVWSVGYNHSWDVGQRFALNYGIGYGKHIFDGEQERSLTAFMSAVFRF